VHASEITHLSLALFPDHLVGGFPEKLLGGLERREWLSPDYGASFTSLRVLELLTCGTPMMGASVELFVEASARLATTVAPSLHTLTVLAPGRFMPHDSILRLLRRIGPTVQLLSLVDAECDVLIDAASATCTLQPRRPWYDQPEGILTEEDAEDALAHMAEAEAVEAEATMDLEMLTNASEGLCIALREPARLLTHAKLASSIVAALPEPSWLR